jgi:hypothetical protein
MGISEDAICIRQPPYAGVALPPVEDRGAATVNTTARPGASAVETTPQAARPEPKVPMAGPAANDPKTAAHLAEIACDILEDARLSYEQIVSSPHTEDQLYGARLRLETAQTAADIAVARNVKVQTALDAKMTFALKTADAEMAGLSKKVHDNPKPDRRDVEQLAALEQKRYAALENAVQSGRSVAVAESLLDIAKGAMPGRGELARDTRLKDAEAARSKLDDAYEQLGHARDITEIKQRVGQVQKAASANRAEWAALNDNAIKSGDADLKTKSKFGLEIAERDLELVNSRRYISSWGLTP